MIEYETATTYMISFVNVQHAYKFWSRSADRNTFSKVSSKPGFSISFKMTHV